MGPLFFRTSTSTKVRLKIRSNFTHIRDYHHLIWPGVEVVQLLSKMSKPSVRGQPQAGQDQEVWLRENTLSTSLMISTMVFCINFKFRNLQDRNAGCDGFLQMFNMLVSAMGSIRMEIIPHGSEDNQLVTLQVDRTGHVDGQQFWSERFYVRHVSRSWNQDVQNQGKQWLKSNHGLGRVHLVELLCFSLDPQHNEFLKGALLPECWNILSQFAKLLDESVELYRCGMDPLSFGDQLKNLKRVSRAVKSVWLEALAQLVWSGEDPFRFSKTHACCLSFLFR